jgi:two-component system, NtrC family, sensor kinase
MGKIHTICLDHDLRTNVSATLTRRGHTVVHSNRFEDALKLMQKGKLEILVIDMKNTPKRMCRFLDNLKNDISSAKIILLDSQGISDSLQLAAKYKVSDLIRQPFSAVEVLKAIEAVAENSKGESNNEWLVEKLYAKIEYLYLLNRVARVVNSTLELDELLEVIISITTDIFKSEASSILLKDNDTDELYFAGATGKKKDSLKKLRIPPGQGIAGYVFESGKPLLIEDISQSKRFYQQVDKKTDFVTKTMIAAPLKTKNKIIGVIEIVNRVDGQPFSERSLKLLLDLTYHISLAVENSMLRQDLLDANSRIESYNHNLEQQVEQRTLQLKIAQEQIVQSEKMASIGQLAAGVAHEINNPLGYINSNLRNLYDYSIVYRELIDYFKQINELVKKSPPVLNRYIKEQREREVFSDLDYLREDTEALIAESQSGCDRVKEIVLSMKSFTRSRDALPELTNINQVIEEILRIVWNEIKYKAEVRKNFSKIDSCYTFPEKIKQVIMNLLVNAGQAIESEGVIELSTSQENEWITIEISDNGDGIPPEVLPRIFEPFYTTKDVGVGTGLGLYISYNIVKKHGGDIQVVSEPGQGTTFRILLPVYKTSSELDKISEEKDDPTPYAVADTG